MLRTRQLISPLLRKPSKLGHCRVRFSTAATSRASAATAANANSKSDLVIKSLAAAAAGILTVSGAAAAVEYGTAATVPPFDPKEHRFPAETFAGRFFRMLLACDPRLLLYTEQDVRLYQDMIKHYKDQTGKDVDRELWEAKRVVDSALHPDTGDVIPRPFRMSGYVAYNGPVCVAMVASQSTLPLLFWAWANQSQNALVNYYNRNASSPLTNEVLAKSYAAAVGSALVVAFGLATAIQKRYPPAQAKQLLRWVAFPSAVVASSLNCYIVRSPEIDSGIPLCDGNGHDVLQGETSQEAAKRGVHSTTISRAILQAPVYFVPPVLLSMGPIKRFVTKNPALTVPVTTYLLLVSFGCGLPGTVAIFPQMSPIKPSEVEPKFQNLQNPATNKPYEVYYYNKGL